jgi:type IV pilus assembly protein PilC
MAATAAATAALKKKQGQRKVETYNWEGVNARGQRVRGELRGASPELVSTELRRQGIVPTRVKKQKQALMATLNKRPVNSKDVTIFVRQLATMMDAGIPLVQSLEILSSGQQNPTMQQLIDNIREEIESGSNLADALRKHPGHFDTLFTNLVEAGESSGTLESLLGRIAKYKERTETIKGKIKKALVYPAAVIMIAIAVVTVIMIFVIPQFEELFRNFGADLPAFTRIVINASNFLVTKGWMLGIGLFIFGYVTISAWKRSEKFQRFVDNAVLRIPVIGTIMHKASVSRFARTLATTFAAGIPIVESLDSVAGASGNVVIGDAVKRMKTQMATGQSMVFAMRQETVFPHMLRQMAAVGEETGSLDEMLNKVADFYEEEVDNAVDALSSLLEPFILVLIGGIVGFLVVALYLPIFNLGNVVG